MKSILQSVPKFAALLWEAFHADIFLNEQVFCTSEEERLVTRYCSWVHVGLGKRPYFCRYIFLLLNMMGAQNTGTQCRNREGVSNNCVAYICSLKGVYQGTGQWHPCLRMWVLPSCLLERSAHDVSQRVTETACSQIAQGCYCTCSEW